MAVRCERLTKQYRLGRRLERYRTLRDSISETVRRIAHGGLRPPAPLLWALDDVTLALPHGEVMGVIGPNGAGKSTLLKILSRITRPTSGFAEIRGRVGSLLEIGTGFHPELTGRENIYLNGAILGMRHREVASRFDAIVAFAEVEKFLDTPVKRYSSGMYMRLAFSVAAHLDTEILLIDEVLAVGDAAFQKKCLNSMSDAAGRGRTVIFVSHNLLAVRDLCNSALWLDQGKVVRQGPANDVVSAYLSSFSSEAPERRWPSGSGPGTGSIELRRARVVPADSDHQRISIRTPLIVEFEYVKKEPGEAAGLSFQLFNQFGILVFETGRPRDPLGKGPASPAGTWIERCFIPGDLLNDGTHRIDFYFQDSAGFVMYTERDLLTFEVHDDANFRDGWYGEWGGAVRPALQWTTVVHGGDPPGTP